MDGDDGGSVLALLHQLEKMGKNVEAAIKKGVPKSLSFLPGSHKIADDINHENYDLLITFGCSSIDRTGSLKIKNLKLKIVNIDHHPDNKMFGTVNVVDPAKSSVAELIYDFFIYNGWHINKHVATCLLTGIITDTGSFRHSNTQSSTLKAAA
jgi:phosphoesterase RecJ-like protein